MAISPPPLPRHKSCNFVCSVKRLCHIWCITISGYQLNFWLKTLNMWPTMAISVPPLPRHKSCNFVCSVIRLCHITISGSNISLGIIISLTLGEILNMWLNMAICPGHKRCAFIMSIFQILPGCYISGYFLKLCTWMDNEYVAILFPFHNIFFMLNIFLNNYALSILWQC